MTATMAAEKKTLEEEEDVLYIPTAQTDVTVVLPWKDMSDAELVVDLFMAEDAPLKYWVDAARVYYNRGMKEQYIYMLKEITNDDVGEHYDKKLKEEDRGKLERVQAFCGLAENEIDEAQAAKTKGERETALFAAQNYLSSAAAIDPSCEVTEQWIAKGQLHLARNEVARAKQSFKEARLRPDYGENVNCSGLLGFAYCCFRQNKWSEALQKYIEVMETLGSAKCPNYVRLAMAACYLRLKLPKMAKKCYQRVLALDKYSAEAQAGLGAQKLISNRKGEAAEGLSLLKRAYDSNPHLSFLLVSLCEQLFHRKEYSDMAKLAQIVVQSGAVEPSIKAEAYFYLGMAYYHADQSDQALRFFRASKEEDPSYVFPNHGIARVLIRKGDVTGAIEILESIVETNAGDLESLINLSVLNKERGEMQKAVQYAERALSIDKKNILLEEYLANLFASLDARKAFKHFNLVMKRKGEAQASPGTGNLILMNNSGVMQYECGEYIKAMSTFGQALKFAEKTIYFYPIKYNIARTHEALGSLQKASDLYKELLTLAPGYMECTLRLAAVCFSMGYVDRSIQYCKEGLKKYKNNPQILAMLVWIYLKQKKPREANNYLQQMLEHCPDEKNFIDTALGGMYLVTANKRSRMGDKENFEKYLHHAMTFFKQALASNSRNMFAAHGLGVCFALAGESVVAKKVFDKILEASKQDIKVVDMPEVWQNKASINLERGSYEEAWRAYMHCNNKFYKGKNTSIARLMAQALNAAGNKDAAAKLLLKASHLAPTDLSLKYGIGVVLMGHAHEVIEAGMQIGDDYEERLESLSFAESRLALTEFYTEFLHHYKTKAVQNNEAIDLDISENEFKRLRRETTLMSGRLKTARKDAETMYTRFKEMQDLFHDEQEMNRMVKEAKDKKDERLEEQKRKEEEERVLKQAEKLSSLQEQWAFKVPAASTKKAVKAEKEDNSAAVNEPSPWDLGFDSEKEEEEEEVPEEEVPEEELPEEEAPTKRKLKQLREESEQENKKKQKLADDLGLDDTDEDMDEDTPGEASQRKTGILESDSE